MVLFVVIVNLLIPIEGVPWTQKFRSPSAENFKLSEVPSFKPGVSQKIALHASLTVRNSAFVMTAVLIHSALIYFFGICFGIPLLRPSLKSWGFLKVLERVAVLGKS